MKTKKFNKNIFFEFINTINNYAKFRRRSHKQHTHICIYIINMHIYLYMLNINNICEFQIHIIMILF